MAVGGEAQEMGPRWTLAPPTRLSLTGTAVLTIHLSSTSAVEHGGIR